VTGHGLPDEEVKRQYALAGAFFDLPLEEKTKYLANTAAGDFRGYKAKATGELVGKDNDERYNIPKFTPEHERPHPQLILDNYEEIKKFSLVSSPKPLYFQDQADRKSTSTTIFFSHFSESSPLL
jgi:isopenicillin N synthase-like dioxygenase